ncbi:MULTISPECIES: hypothetical protein [Burkholderia]|nr:MULTISPECIES: hypothetical protein [Burkholderia]UJH77894.1 hypothetical protein L0U95_34080 [Burkholderia cenocepacia]
MLDPHRECTTDRRACPFGTMRDGEKAGYRFTEVDIAGPAAAWRTTRRHAARAHAIIPAEGRRRISSEKRRSDAGRTDAGPHRGRPVMFHSGGERRHVVPGSEACAAGSLTLTAGAGSIDPTP